MLLLYLYLLHRNDISNNAYENLLFSLIHELRRSMMNLIVCSLELLPFLHVFFQREKTNTFSSIVFYHFNISNRYIQWGNNFTCWKRSSILFLNYLHKLLLIYCTCLSLYIFFSKQVDEKNRHSLWQTMKKKFTQTSLVRRRNVSFAYL